MHSEQPKRVILCADDFGQNQGISEGILNLASQGRISAISCMVNATAWQQQSASLRKYDEIGVGLHLNFTHGEPLSVEWQREHGDLFPSLSRLIFKSISSTVISAEIEAQIRKFKQDMSKWPEFIDGHQHVHQLPLISECLLQVVQRLDFKPWFRTTYGTSQVLRHPFASIKQWALCGLGGAKWERHLRQLNYNYNTNFAGDYHFSGMHNYQHLMQGFLKRIQTNGLIMCHPGVEDAEDVEDPISNYRTQEYDYLMSDEFVQDQELYQIQLISRPF
jgi:chitin disaccharide deacetylase